MAMSSLIKTLEDTMRTDAGLNGDAQYIEQITWLLFLKAFDAKEEEWEMSALMKKKDYNPVIPVGYRWRDWAENKEGITGDSLIEFVNDLFSTLKKLDISSGDLKKFVVKNVFEDINNYMKSGINLRNLINKINEKVDFVDATKKHTFNDLYEGMLKDLQSAGKAGEFYTPRPVTNFIVEKVNPKLGEKVLDPACGTGGFLTSTINYIGKVNTVEELEKLQSSINGWEKKPLPYLLAMTNLILHDIEVPQIKHGNSLAKPLTEYTNADKVDVIVANPPFGGNEDSIIKENFPKRYQTSETADLFLVLMMTLLKDNGRCGIVLPDGFMFGDGVKNTIKKELLDEYGLHTIVRLPQVFKPYADVYTNLLFFEKGKKSGGVWFYRMDMPEGYKNFTKTKPMEDKHFDVVREWWSNKHEIQEGDSYKSKFYSYDELIDINGINLNFDKCCPFPKNDEEILPLPILIQEYQDLAQNFASDIDKLFKQIKSKLKDSIPEGEVVNFELNRFVTLSSSLKERIHKSIILEAIQGNLTEGNSYTESGNELVDRIIKYKNNLINAKILKMDSKKTANPIKDDDYTLKLPSHWGLIRFSNLANFQAGKTPEKNNQEYWKNKDIPWISIADMISDGYTITTKDSISNIAINECFNNNLVEPDTILMSFKLTIGKMTKTSTACVHNEAIIAIYPFLEGEENTILKEYLFRIMPLISQNGDFSNAVKGKTLNASSISNLLVPIPPLEEQKLIIEKIDDLFKLLEKL